MIFLLLFLSVVHGQPCSDIAAVEIKNPQIFHDGTVFQDGVTYTRENVFAKNVSGTVKTFGCLCNVKRCFRKCCPIGSVLELSTKKCAVKPAEDILLVDGIDLHFFNTFTKKVGLASSHFAVTIGYPDVPGKFYREIAQWYIQEGELFLTRPTLVRIQWDESRNSDFMLKTFLIRQSKTSTSFVSPRDIIRTLARGARSLLSALNVKVEYCGVLVIPDSFHFEISDRKVAKELSAAHISCK